MSPSVIVIDDDPAVLQSLVALLETAGYAVYPFPSAVKFLLALRGLPASCIVTDLRMPGMDGLALLTRLKTELQVTWPVVVMSGHAEAPDAVAAMEAGAVDFLVKPFPPQQLLTIISTWSVSQ